MASDDDDADEHCDDGDMYKVAAICSEEQAMSSYVGGWW